MTLSVAAGPNTPMSTREELDYRYLQGEDPNRTVLLRLKKGAQPYADKTEREKGLNLAETRDRLLEEIGVDSLDVFHTGGPTGTAKDGPADRAAAALLAAHPDTRGAGLVVDLFTSGNTSEAWRRAFESRGVQASLRGFVNGEMGREMMDLIGMSVGELVVLNGRSPEPFDDVIGGVDPDVAHRRHLWRVAQAGGMYEHLFVPVGSGVFASHNIVASRWIATARFLDALGCSDVDKVMEEIYPQEEGVYASELDRVPETPDFSRLKAFLMENSPQDLQGVDEIQDLLPVVHLCGENGLLLSQVSRVNGRWVAQVRVDGSHGSVGITDTLFRDVAADKLWAPRTTWSHVNGLLEEANTYPDKIRVEIATGYRIMRLDAIANDARIHMEPSAVVPLAGVESAVSRGDLLNDALVMSTGRGAFYHPRHRATGQLVHEAPFQGWTMPR